MIEISATAATRSDSVRVRATESGTPTEIHVDRSEFHYGGTELARTILHLCARATELAQAERRTLLENDGMEAHILDRLGLPRASTVAAEENRRLDVEPAPTSWLRSV
ncbi:hypothetical protein E5720_03535 [Rhodococcus sp. PAMC28707]|uniref:hypothetical protein n=1 Tax=unclassified Rhodococcus (in: high G+C Gram-positive bacteria) TaxID=192944 RepID=UPI00109D99DE|nr:MULTISPECIES: hypothetical protein [unclassified Rhodococcus (in: high G+C Gram-positive bacteria)]QCB50612.1 hypothetical protein E5769_10480 [Rhodococcus sp. PAMC28705]QCB57696.1 hypothetical protein E5720_03535 [Rhodococcus sp. PAMC28707]